MILDGVMVQLSLEFVCEVDDVALYALSVNGALVSLWAVPL